MDKQRPDRAELFGYYYLGFAPNGAYRFPNAHQVAGWYRTSADTVLTWLEEYDLSPGHVAGLKMELARASVDLQMEAPNLTPEAIRERIAAILADLDNAEPGRRPWIDGPIS